MDRMFAYEAKGRTFDSCRAHHKPSRRQPVASRTGRIDLHAGCACQSWAEIAPARTRKTCTAVARDPPSGRRNVAADEGRLSSWLILRPEVPTASAWLVSASAT